MSLYILGRCSSCSHASVMCWIVSDSFPYLLHNSTVSGCFKIYFLQFLVSMTWSRIAVKKPSFSANKSAFVSHYYYYYFHELMCIRSNLLAMTVYFFHVPPPCYSDTHTVHYVHFS